MSEIASFLKLRKLRPWHFFSSGEYPCIIRVQRNFISPPPSGGPFMYIIVFLGVVWITIFFIPTAIAAHRYSWPRMVVTYLIGFMFENVYMRKLIPNVIMFGRKPWLKIKVHAFKKMVRNLSFSCILRYNISFCTF